MSQPQTAGLLRRIQGLNRHWQQVERSQQTGYFHARRLFQHLPRRPAFEKAPGLNDEHLLAQFETLVQVMRDEQDGNAELRSHLSQNVMPFRAQKRIQAAGRRVQQEQPGLPDERARDRAALRLGLGNLAGAAAGHFRQAKAFKHLAHPAVPLKTGQAPARGGKQEVLAKRHVREQRVALEDVPAAPGMRGQIDPRATVKQNLVVNENPALIRLDETGDGIEEHGLARAARSEQCGDPARRAHLEVQRKPGGAGSRGIGLANPSLDHFVACLGTRRFARIQTATEIASTSAHASVPPPFSIAL